MNSIVISILNMSLNASWIMLIIILIRPLLKKFPKWVSCLLWGIAGIKLAIPFTIESPFSLIPRTANIPLNNAEVVLGNTEVISVNNVNIYHQTAEAANVTAQSQSIDFNSVIPIVWLIGMVAMLAYVVVSTAKIRRIVTVSIKTEDGIFVCDDIKTPFILGIFRPRIYLPTGLNQNSRSHILEHERAHLKRLDNIWKPIGYLLLSVHWFNPLVWISYNLFCKDIELACDEHVISSMNPSEKADYSETLLSFGKERRLAYACPLAFGEVGIKDRVKNIFSYKRPGVVITVVALAICLVVGVCFITHPVAANENEATVHEDNSVIASETEDALTEMKENAEPVNEVKQDISENTSTEENNHVETETATASETSDLAESDNPKSIENTSPSSTYSWIWPCDSTHVTSMFGKRFQPINNATEYTDHICIGGEKGDSVYAACSGTVETAEYDAAKGNYVVLAHATGSDANIIKTEYRHLDELKVQKGDVISEGSIIGTIGATGMATGPNLGFCVTLNEEYVNPLNYYDID